MPKNIDMHWDKIQNAEYYQINLALKEDFSDAKTYVTLSNKLSLNDLYVASTYYWNIEAFDVNGELIGTSRNYNFATMALPRTINIDGVSNTRDIGGKKTINGKKIKQGMLYRTATIDNITEKGKKSALYTYGIKTDLDLRNAEEGYKGASPIDPNLNYVNVPGCYWVGGNDGLDNEDNWENRMLKELKVFTKKENYPIVFHCSLGQDRTGSLALVLEALLGVTGNELAIDYELSSFSKVVWDAGVIWVSDKLQYQYGPLYDYLDSFGTEENTFMEKVELYVKAVGLTDADIASIRSIMWEE